MKAYFTRADIEQSIAESMRQFGYPDVTNEMAGEILDAYIDEIELPHGVIGMFLKSQFDELTEAGINLSNFRSVK